MQQSTSCTTVLLLCDRLRIGACRFADLRLYFQRRPKQSKVSSKVEASKEGVKVKDRRREGPLKADRQSTRYLQRAPSTNKGLSKGAVKARPPSKGIVESTRDRIRAPKKQWTVPRRGPSKHKGPSKGAVRAQATVEGRH
jgi:hypothetical protein